MEQKLYCPLILSLEEKATIGLTILILRYNIQPSTGGGLQSGISMTED